MFRRAEKLNRNLGVDSTERSSRNGTIQVVIHRLHLLIKET